LKNRVIFFQIIHRYFISIFKLFSAASNYKIIAVFSAAVGKPAPLECCRRLGFDPAYSSKKEYKKSIVFLLF
jgi:hypothetical protein